jgi:hypothetical protein
VHMVCEIVPAASVAVASTRVHSFPTSSKHAASRQMSWSEVAPRLIASALFNAAASAPALTTSLSPYAAELPLPSAIAHPGLLSQNGAVSAVGTDRQSLPHGNSSSPHSMRPFVQVAVESSAIKSACINTSKRERAKIHKEYSTVHCRTRSYTRRTHAHTRTRAD